MKLACAFIADGTEEGELINVVDILKRAGVNVVIVSVDGIVATSSHGVKITADALIKDAPIAEADLLFVPGGMPGSKRMGECKELITAIRLALAADKRVAAICAAPALVLGANGCMTGKRGVCFPGFEYAMTDCEIDSAARVVTDGNITTARGLGCAIDLGLELVRLLCGKDKAEEVKSKIQY